MIKFTLYSEEHPKGLELAKVLDESQSHVMTGYYKNTYNDERFLVTKRYPRKKEERVTGFYQRN